MVIPMFEIQKEPTVQEMTFQMATMIVDRVQRVVLNEIRIPVNWDAKDIVEEMANHLDWLQRQYDYYKTMDPDGMSASDRQILLDLAIRDVLMSNEIRDWMRELNPIQVSIFDQRTRAFFRRRF